MKTRLLLLPTLMAVTFMAPVSAREGDSTEDAGPADTVAAVNDTATAIDTTAAADTAGVVPDQGAAAGHPATENKANDIVVVKEDLDTVFIFDKSVLRHVARDWRNNIDIFRQRGYGASGSSIYGADAIFIRPVEELTENHPELSDKRFDFGRFGFEPFLMSGGSGYVGLGEGFRLGGGGMSGERKFRSSRFNGDSILVLNTKVSYGGFLIEKCFIHNRWNLNTGGMIGAGSIKVTKSEQINTFFYGENENPFDIDDSKGSHRAVFFLLEPHCGFSYTFFYFFHVGATVTLPTFMSLEKFDIYTDDFFTVNPGLHTKLIFGNLG